MDGLDVVCLQNNTLHSQCLSDMPPPLLPMCLKTFKVRMNMLVIVKVKIIVLIKSYSHVRP